jgi:hypothetical protein
MTKNGYPYQLAAGISHPAIPRTIKVITWSFSEYSADEFDWMTVRSRLLRSRQHSNITSRKERNPLNCHYPALRGIQLNKEFSTQFLNHLPFLSLYKWSSIDPLINFSHCRSDMSSPWSVEVEPMTRELITKNEIINENWMDPVRANVDGRMSCWPVADRRFAPIGGTSLYKKQLGIFLQIFNLLRKKREINFIIGEIG